MKRTSLPPLVPAERQKGSTSLALSAQEECIIDVGTSLGALLTRARALVCVVGASPRFWETMSWLWPQWHLGEKQQCTSSLFFRPSLGWCLWILCDEACVNMSLWPWTLAEKLREGPARGIISVVSQRCSNCYAWLSSKMCGLACFLPHSFPNVQCSRVSITGGTSASAFTGFCAYGCVKHCIKYTVVSST